MPSRYCLIGSGALLGIVLPELVALPPCQEDIRRDSPCWNRDTSVPFGSRCMNRPSPGWYIAQAGELISVKSRATASRSANRGLMGGSWDRVDVMVGGSDAALAVSAVPAGSIASRGTGPLGSALSVMSPYPLRSTRALHRLRYGTPAPKATATSRSA